MMNKNIEQLSVHKLSIDSIIEYGKEVNLDRHLTHIYDGLKPSYRRVALVSLEADNNKLIKTSKITADTSKYHVHGTDGLRDVAGELVRWKLLDGQGNIGLIKGLDEELKDSAPRYTEVKVSNKLKNLSKDLIPLTPSFINELGNKEVE